LPKIFYGNWFLKDENGKFMWPGYGENSRILAYIFDRCNDKSKAVDTPIGKVPAPGALNLEGLSNIDETKLAKLLEVDTDLWKAEVVQIEEHYARFGNHIPAELQAELDQLKQRLGV
jgi:phosphoenolpyruvate carboxykinase (GTP)